MVPGDFLTLLKLAFLFQSFGIELVKHGLKEDLVCVY